MSGLRRSIAITIFILRFPHFRQTPARLGRAASRTEVKRTLRIVSPWACMACAGSFRNLDLAICRSRSRAWASNQSLPPGLCRSTTRAKRDSDGCLRIFLTLGRCADSRTLPKGGPALSAALPLRGSSSSSAPPPLTAQHDCGRDTDWQPWASAGLTLCVFGLSGHRRRRRGLHGEVNTIALRAR